MLQLENIIKYHAIKTNQRVLGEYIMAAVDLFQCTKEEGKLDIEELDRKAVDAISTVLEFKEIRHFITDSEVHYSYEDSYINFEMGCFYCGNRKLDLTASLEDIIKIIMQEF